MLSSPTELGVLLLDRSDTSVITKSIGFAERRDECVDTDVVVEKYVYRCVLIQSRLFSFVQSTKDQHLIRWSTISIIRQAVVLCGQLERLQWFIKLQHY